MRSSIRTAAILTSVSLLFSGCSWTVNFVVANLSSNSIRIGYYVPESDEGYRFLKEPKTYEFSESVKDIYHQKKAPEEISTKSSFDPASRMLIVSIDPGQAVYFGYYLATSEDPDSVLAKYKFTVWPGKATVSEFRHWENRFTDLMEIK